MIQVNTTRRDRIVQGDIIRDVEYLEYYAEAEGIIQVSRIIFPLAVVLTQDCDLEQDPRFRSEETQNDDKHLLSALVAPIYNAEHVYAGEHLQELDLRMASVRKNKTEGNFLRNNERPRYHYLDFPTEIPIAPSVIDFKHYFSVHINYLTEVKKRKYVCTLAPLFRENVTQRFSNFLARIGLPEAEERPHSVDAVAPTAGAE